MTTVAHKPAPDTITSVGPDLRDALREQRYALVSAADLTLSPELTAAFDALQASWGRLTPDTHFGGGDRAVRTRRYSDFIYVPATGELAPLDHVAYYQSEAMNAFVGGIERHFGDVEEATYRNPLFQALVRYDFDNLPIEDEYRDRAWVCQIHQIRIEINPGQYNELVPEGIHSDGYPWAGLHLISRVDVEGGHSTVFTWDEEPLAKGTFRTPLDSLIFEDRAMKHHVTGLSAAEDKGGYRDVLAISFSLPGSPYETLV
ncbi:2OG-Fe dioxygenase family protein [Streptomyces sp. NPDC051364]|uniref:2OG-Fe dioxygenase family protein n=1 Tax=Streptomyces sp. NPDC051364 TaxID=3155799 RepID=UPI003431BD40